MASGRPARCPALPKGDLWVFAYGSLMWRPGFDFTECAPARVYGFRRALCLRSIVYRGTPENPGLVFGLAAGGSCLGRAYRVRRRDKPLVLRYLWEREMIHNAYVPTLLDIRIGGDKRTGLGFVVDTTHPQYVAELSADVIASIIDRSRGAGGSNRDYFFDTLAHLEAMGVCTKSFENIARQLRGAEPDAAVGQAAGER